MGNIIKSKIIDSQIIDINKETIYFEDECYTPSDIGGKQFCDGFSEGIGNMIDSFALDNKDFHFTCNPIPIIDNEDIDTKKLQSINDSNIQKLIPQQFLDIEQNIESINPETNQKIITKTLVEKLIAKKEKGKKSGDFCELDLEQMEQKFCKGFQKGVDIMIGKANLNRSKIKSNCISEPIPFEKSKRKIIYGIQRN